MLHLVGNKSQRDRETMEKKPETLNITYWQEHKRRCVWCIFTPFISHWCFCIHDLHSLLIPYYKSMPAAPSTTPTACLTGFSHLGEVKWRSHCSITNKHYIANLFFLIKVLLGCPFHLLVYTHSSIELRCKLGNLAEWHFCLGEKSVDSKIKNLFYIKSSSVLRYK